MIWYTVTTTWRHQKEFWKGDGNVSGLGSNDGVNTRFQFHYNDVIMSAMASQITSLSIVYPIVKIRRTSKKTSKLRVTGLCMGNSPHKGLETREKHPQLQRVRPIPVFWLRSKTCLADVKIFTKIMGKLHEHIIPSAVFPVPSELIYSSQDFFI